MNESQGRQLGVPQYVAHVSEDGERFEAVLTHLEEVAGMAAKFAEPFGAQSFAHAAGLLHDIGKYSREFQDRILRDGPKVDHSTAGAEVMFNICSWLSYCIAGHHGGLPDGGSRADVGSTLWGRINKARDHGIPSYDAWRDEVGMPAVEGPVLEYIPKCEKDRIFTFAFLTRMVFSCLVDADFLCTERFMRGRGRETSRYESLETLRDKLEARLSSFYPPKSKLNEVRCALLDECKEKAAYKPGVFSLTAPTGAGKTYALMRFALQHACEHGMSRVIVVEPYTSIIEQNAAVYREVFGSENLLEHHSNCDLDADDNDDGIKSRLRLAAENWDAPIIVSTNVQLFESLYSNRTSRCRKLHNIVGSVIVLDEAQMVPTDYLVPCVRALAELVHNYNCSLVLSTATQPALSKYFNDAGLAVSEIVSDVPSLFDSLKRVSYRAEGKLSDVEVAQRLALSGSALCIVNSRKQAFNLFELLDSEGVDGIYYLTTLMYPAHRKCVLAEIHHRMKVDRAPCIVVATSLVEAGVDLDFPVVYRAIAGVDSMVQAAGRCNREGLRHATDSIVHLFEPADAYAIPAEVRQRAQVSFSAVPALSDAGSEFDLSSSESVGSYFSYLYFFKGEDALDKEGILKEFDGRSVAFKTIAERFKLIREGAYPVVIPGVEVHGAIERIREGEAFRSDMRRVSAYTVSVYEHDLKELLAAGKIERLASDLFVLADASQYSEQTGLDLAALTGEGMFW